MKLNTSPRSTRLSHTCLSCGGHTHDRALAGRGATGAALRCARSRRSGPASDVRRTRGSRGAARRRLAPAGPTLNLSATRAGRTRDDRSLNHAPTERVRPRPTTRAASGGCAQPCRSCGHGCMRHKLQTEPQAGRGRNLRHPVYLLVQHTRPVHLAAGCIMCMPLSPGRCTFEHGASREQLPDWQLPDWPVATCREGRALQSARSAAIASAMSFMRATGPAASRRFASESCAVASLSRLLSTATACWT